MKTTKKQFFSDLFSTGNRKLTACVLTVFVICFLCSCNRVNPNIGSGEEAPTSSSTSVKRSTDVPEYIDADALSYRSYELSFLLAQKKFNSPNDINVNALVQYAFCHLNYDNFTDMPDSGMKMRTASFEDIQNEVKKHFGDVSTDIKKSDLYNGAKNCFEIWQPNYGGDIFYGTEISGSGNNTYKVMTTFYTDSSKETTLGKTILTVKDENQQILIQRLSSSN